MISHSAHPFYTIGHSTRSIEDFAALLGDAGVDLVVDVRTVPRSRFNPHYNRDVLPGELSPFGIGYEHIAALGGLRGKRGGVPDEVNAFWENRSFHNYADYAMGAEFRDGFARLRERGAAQVCAIMCAETLWWRCHRRIITDYLIAAGETVRHILGPGDIKPASPTPAAEPREGGVLVYPPAAPRLL